MIWHAICKKTMAWNVLLVFIIVLVGCSSTAIDSQATPSAATPTASIAPTALVVYGQPDFTSHALYPTGQNTLYNASAIAVDGHGGVYVADYNNSRVLHFPNFVGRGVAPQADMVYGQTDYASHDVHRGARGLNFPHGVAMDGKGELYVADTFNNRILHYPPSSTTADRVYGQPNFDGAGANSGGIGPETLSHPQGLAIDATGLYVADSQNNRVLHFPEGKLTADFVYGQGTPGNSPANFSSHNNESGSTGLNDPRDVALDKTGLYIVDSGNHRVVHYPFADAVADRVYGQLGFASTSVSPNQGKTKPTATTLNNPTGVAVGEQGRLYIADRNNNRILCYPSFAQQKGNDPAAIRVYGQATYTSDEASTSASTFHGPGAVSIDDGRNMFVLDIFNQRMLKFVTSD